MAATGNETSNETRQRSVLIIFSIFQEEDSSEQIDFGKKKKKKKGDAGPLGEEGQPVPVQEVDTSGEPDYSYDEVNICNFAT